MKTHLQDLAVAVRKPQGSINKWLYVHGVHSAGERTAILAAVIVIIVGFLAQFLPSSRRA